MSAWIEAVGFMGRPFAILTYSMMEILRLRITAVVGCRSFIVCGAMSESWPLTLIEMALLPINLWRLIELRRAERLTITNPQTGI